jgi:hypothetical protein
MEKNRVCAIIVLTGDYAEGVRQISSTRPRLGKSILYLNEYVRKGLGPAAGANIAGLKAGITTGVVTLVKSLKEGRSDDHEGRIWS